MKTIITNLVLFFFINAATAQITGASTVCAGFTYSYTANMPGAVNLTWSFPSGWYGINQGNPTATATCNDNDGTISCEGFDINGNSLGIVSLLTQFGGGSASGWDVQPASVVGCSSSTFTISIIPNGTGGGGGCPPGCGSGTLHPNIHYALYNNIWPFGTFIVYADGFSTAFVSMNLGMGYVYQVDVTNGVNPPQAVRITGGCGTATVNNVCTIGLYPTLFPAFSQTPVAPCVGDTVHLYETTGLSNPCWGCSSNISGLNVIGSGWTNPLTAIVTGNSPAADVTGIDANGCTAWGIYNVNVAACVAPSITGDTIVCSGYTYSYAATIPGAVTYNWTFPNGWYNITGQGTSSVSATCNVNAGNISCQGFDGLGNTLGTLSLTTQFGGGTPVGWDVQPQNPISCNSAPITLNIVPNSSGSGSCPNGCGNGIAVTNVGFAVYDNVWPLGNFVGFADGSSLPVPLAPGTYSYYIYYIDYTAGTNTSQVILIEGGCGTASNNNIVQLTIPFPNGVGFNQFPNPVCIGDTVDINAGAWSGSNWSAIMGITILSTNGLDLTAIVNSIPARAQFTGTDFYGCPVSDICYINSISCTNSLVGDTLVCAGIVYNYSVNTPGAVSYSWLFPPGWYNITGQGTPNASATCDGTNGWVSVSSHNGSGGIIAFEQLLAQIGSPSYCAGSSVTGDTVVCAGYYYSYLVSIPGAVTYTWTFPAGWYDIAGQGTANVVATCNLNDGNICAEGFDALGNSVGTQCILTQFGGGGFSGWDVQPPSVTGCTNSPFTVSVVPNGTGGGLGCPPGCGNGTLHPFIKYALYDNVWPIGNFLGYADGASTMFLGPFGGLAYVYHVDVTDGLNPPLAVRIDGGCGSAVANNICSITPLIPNPPAVSQIPMPACIGDTIQLFETTGLTNIGWGAIGFNDLNLLSSQFSNPLIAVVTGSNPYTDVTGVDGNGCLSYLPLVPVILTTCAIVPNVQIASSDTIFCDKQSINFSDISTNNPTSWQWFFPGGAPSTSTSQNPLNIYYATSGSFDVTLIACNSAGCDTLTLTDFIVEYNAAYDSIYKSNDTLYSLPATTYQWYEVSSGVIAGATLQYYVPLVAGNYYCIIHDSVGCADASNTIAVTVGIEELGNGPPIAIGMAINPNPNSGLFTLELNSKSAICNLQLAIVNALGEVMYEKDFKNVNGRFTEQINLSSKSKGIYFLQIIADEKVFQKKIVVR